MIITRAPLRIPLGGGGTDLPSYYSQFGGFFLSAAINKYIYISAQPTFGGEIIVKYSEVEQPKQVHEIRHDIIREALKLHNIHKGIEVVSFADIPAGTGLGSSGAFSVALLRSLYAFKGQIVPTHTLAEEANYLMMNVLRRPDGKQDQHVAVFGGINCYTIDRDGKVDVEPLVLTRGMLEHLTDKLVMFFTGFYRQSETILAIQREKSEMGNSEMLENLHFIKDLGRKIKDALEAGNFDRFGDLMHMHWEHKKKRAPTMTNALIDKWYTMAMKNGARGGKIMGAGGGGFLLFYADDRGKVVNVLRQEGLKEVRFNFDFEGAKLIVVE